MKLLAQFYACLAIIVVFTAVFNGIEARSSNFMAAAGSRRGWLAEEQPAPPQKQELDDGTNGYRLRRAATFMTEEKPDQTSKQTDEEPPKAPPKVRRNAPENPETQNKQQQAEESPDKEQKRNRRQTMPNPPGMPSPDQIAKQMPMPPQGRK